ncbi:hypothetical protein [Mucilaginibacter gilvus]|uniref:Uncharacterized protein n=1 Tax=Mucilaginibacter gilvus TaxID=2305909 RepID=A0A444MMH4_9SPHI|nr:hypothetical protein [Mucilaginibacter gilvus]RWY50921.1 hypothetical protein EPL05_12670 [Mucilaginibacter gilvus]
MSISAYQQTSDVQLKVVNVNKTPNATANTGVASSKIFSISFNYLKTAYHTKVMKVLYAGRDAMYKVVMPSSLNEGSNMHWLQRQDEAWVVIMGEPIDAKLLKAVTASIDIQE